MFIHNIDPAALRLGSFTIYWYGLSYLFGIFIAWGLGRFRAKKWNFRKEEIDDLILYMVLAIILGGRLGYVLFYNSPHYLKEPLDIFKLWEGGMSFHGAAGGIILAIFYFAKKIKKTFLNISDFLLPLITPGLCLGRIANFINAELYGKPTTVFFGVVFPQADQNPRHPSQLYEAFLEGLLLFFILWVYSKTKPVTGKITGLFLFLYGLFRFLVEFVREPDSQLGYLAFNWLTMGQLLSFPMILVGLILLFKPFTQKQKKY